MMQRFIQQNQFGQEVGAALNFIEPCQLTIQPEVGRTVQLIPMLPNQLDNQLIKKLWQSVQKEPDASCWTYLPYEQMQNLQQLQDYFQNAFCFEGAIHYVIQINDEVVGWIALLNLRPHHAVVEIGNVYFSNVMKRSTAATETIYLLLAACFAAGYRRVEWKCDDLNMPSKKAALRFGFEYEGLFRQHVIVKGRNRDTAWFSMLDHQWNDILQAYQAWLKPDNFDGDGQQKIHLKDFMQLYAV